MTITMEFVEWLEVAVFKVFVRLYVIVFGHLGVVYLALSVHPGMAAHPEYNVNFGWRLLTGIVGLACAVWMVATETRDGRGGPVFEEEEE